jgi:hypothetical protein
MFKGDIRSEFTVLDNFIEDNFDTINDIIKQARGIIPPDDCESIDQWNEEVAQLVSYAILADQLEIVTPIPFDDNDAELLFKLTNIMVVHITLEDMVRKGILERVGNGYTMVGSAPTEAD